MMKQWLWAVGCTWMLSGCGVLQSEKRIEQVGALRTDYSKLDLKSQIEVPRNNRQKLLDEQLAVIDALAEVRADGALRGFVSASQNTLGKQLDDLRTSMDVPAASPQLPHSRDSIDDARGQVRKLGLNIAHAGLDPVGCAQVKGDSAEMRRLQAWVKAHSGTPQAQTVTITLPHIKATCDKAEQMEAANAKAYADAPAIRPLVQRRDQERAELNALETASQDLRAKFKASLAALEAAEEKKDPKTIAEQAADVKKAFDDLKGMQDAFAIELLSTEKVKAIYTFLAEVSGYDPVKKNLPSSRAALAALFFSELFREIGAAGSGAGKADWSPLVAQKKIEKAQADGAIREIAIRKRRVALLETMVRLRAEQLDRFAQIRTIPLEPMLLALPVAVVLQTEPPATPSAKTAARIAPTTEDRLNVHRIIAYTIDARTRMDAEFLKTELRLNALDGEILLGYSEASIHQWAALLDANVASLETAYKAAISAKQINEFVDSALLFWIGKGVN